MKKRDYNATYASLVEAFDFLVRLEKNDIRLIRPIQFISLLDPEHGDAQFSEWKLSKNEYPLIRMMANATTVTSPQQFIEEMLELHLI